MKRETYRNRFPRMVHEHYLGRVREVMEERRRRIGALASKKDALRYIDGVRARVADAFGDLPPRTPLKAVVTGRIDRGSCEIEKVVFESRPGLQVTSNLYLPRERGRAAPAVLGLCGHSPDGKAAPLYQSFCQGLVAKGFVVLIIDPISQGERLQFSSERGERVPTLCGGHNIMGNQLFLLGGFFGSWRVWDAIRALDYLESRPEVDGGRIGVTGNSGGGTLTTSVAALDPRPCMVAPSCYVSSFLAALENEIPADSEQNPPRSLLHGLDQVDLLLCHAPRPTLILSQHGDFFDHRRAENAFGELRRIHRLLGREEWAAYYCGSHDHGYYQDNREAMYGFFMRHAGVQGEAGEPEIRVADASELDALPPAGRGAAEGEGPSRDGTDARSGGRRVFDFIREEGRRLVDGRKPLGVEELRKAAARLLGIDPVRRPVRCRSLWHYRGARPDLAQQQQFALETEGGIQVVVATYGKPHASMHLPDGPCTLYVGHVSAEEDVERAVLGQSAARQEGWDLIRRRLEDAERSFVAVDPRGFGQSLARTCGSERFFEPYGADFLYASASDQLGESYLGKRVGDVLCVLNALRDAGAEDVELVGRGFGSVIAAFAALLDASKPPVTLIHYLPSYHLLTQNPLADWPLSLLVRGVLRELDLPDVYESLGERLALVAPWGAVLGSGAGN